MLLDGDGVASDPIEAKHWALAAAEQGIATAMTRLGMIFHQALGVERDPTEAVRWWRRAAEHGEADGQAMLGAALHLGLPPDPVAALAWLLRARAGGSRMADPFVGPVRAVLAPDQIAEAERRALESLPEPPP